ncbi:MAG: ABC transporter ATP-binding protein [Bacteroidales bacterium]
MDAIFQATGVTKRFAAHTALNKVSITVPRGGIFGLLGPNGAGKTTLIRIINQITGPDEGEILLDGKPMHMGHIYEIGYLPEERGLYKKMKVGEQALYLAQLKGMKKQQALKQLKIWFEKFEIQGWWNKKVEELSKGMQQKVQFIITVLHEPRLLIFDEPFSGFDPINVNLIKEEILNLKAKGSTIIFSTHNMASVEELCDHIALINQSQKILEGKVKDIKRAYKANEYEVSFFQPGRHIRELLKPGIELLDLIEDDDHFKAKIKLAKEFTSNDLLSLLIPHVEIHAMHEIIPTMNDIFIAAVNEDKEGRKHQL